MSGTVVTEIIVKGQFDGADQVQAAATVAQRAVDKFIKSQEELNAAQKATAAGGNQQSQQLQESTRSYNAAAAAADRYLGRLSPTINAQNQLTAEITRVQTAMDGLGKQLGRTADFSGEYNKRMALLSERHTELQTSLQGVTSGAVPVQKALETLSTQAERGLTPSINRSTGAMRALSVQMPDVVQGLLTGQGAFQLLIQQGGQVFQVMQMQGTLLSGLKSAWAAIISPIGLTVAALAAVGAVAAVVVARSSAMADETRALDVAIRGVGRSAELSASQVQRYVSALNQQGVGRGDAAGIIASLARNSALSGPDIGRVTALTPDTAAAMGVDAAAAAKAVADVATGSYAAIVKLDDAMNFLTRDQRVQIRTMLEHGDRIGATAIAMDELRRHTDGAREKSLGPWEKAWDDVTNAINRTIDAAARAKVNLPLAVVSPLAAGIASALTPDAPGPTPRGAEVASMAALNTELDRQLKIIDPLTKKQDEENKVLAVGIPSRARVRAEIEAANIVAEKGLTGDAARALTKSMVTTATLQAADAASQEAQAISRQIQGSTMLVTALGQSRTAEAFAAAAIEAHDKASTQAGVSENAYARAILNRNAAQEAVKASTAARDLDEQSAAIQRLIDAQGAEGRQAVELANKVIEATRQLDALEATTTRVDVLEAIIKARDALKEKIPLLDKQNIALRERNALEKGQFQIEDARKEIELIGASAEVRERELAAFRKLQELRQTDKADINNLTEAQKALIAQARDYADTQLTLRDRQTSLAAVTDTLGTAFDRVGQAMVDAFLSGQGAAVNLGNVLKGIAASVLSDFAKLAAINPILNALIPSSSGPRPTIGAAFGAVSGGSGGSSFGIGDILSLGGLSDSLGLTSIKSFLADKIGLGGAGGFLSTPLFGAGVGGATALDSSGAFIAANGALVQNGAAASLSLGGALGLAGAGFGLGSIAGGFTQSAMGKVGYGPQVGAGLGALAGLAAFPLIGPFGPILGGLLGGAGGGLIGPNAPNAYSTTGVSLDHGRLALGGTLSQLVDTTAEVENAKQQLAQINGFLDTFGLTLDTIGKLGQVGQNTPGKAGDPTKFGDLASAFSEFRFTSADPLVNKQIAGQSFGDLNSLQAAVAEVTNFVNQTVPALKALANTDVSFGIGSLGTAVAQLQATFAPAIAMAEKLGYSETDLAAIRDKAITAAVGAAQDQLRQTDAALVGRFYAARAANENTPQYGMQAALYNFDLQADAQRKQFSDQLLAAYGDTFKATQQYTDQMAYLEQALGQERLATTKQYTDQIAAIEAQAAQEREQAAAQAARAAEAAAQLAAQQAAQAAQAAAAQAALGDQAYRTGYAQFLRNQAALGALSGDPQYQQMAALEAFDYQAQQQRDAFSAQLLAAFGDAYKSTAEYADLVVKFETTLGNERLVAAKQYADQIAAIDKQAADTAIAQAKVVADQQTHAAQTAAGTITSITQFVRGLQTGPNSPLSVQSQYALASRQFDAVSGAAQAGDFNSIQQFTSYASALIDASRNLFGSGAGFVRNFEKVVDAAQSISSISPEALTSAVFINETRDAAQTVVDGLSEAFADFRSVLVEVRDELRHRQGGPPVSQTG